MLDTTNNRAEADSIAPGFKPVEIKFKMVTEIDDAGIRWHSIVGELTGGRWIITGTEYYVEVPITNDPEGDRELVEQTLIELNKITFEGLNELVSIEEFDASGYWIAHHPEAQIESHSDLRKLVDKCGIFATGIALATINANTTTAPRTRRD